MNFSLAISNTYKYFHWWLYGPRTLHSSNNDDYELIQIDPKEIIYEGTLLNPKNYNPGAVVSGSWDIKRKKFENTLVFESLYNHFVEDIDWEETKKYRRDIELAEQNKKKISVRDVKIRYNELDKIYQDIKNNGYKTQKELLESKPNETKSLNDDRSNIILNEISICIGRDGTLFRHGSGRHRLAIAKIQGLSSIPVLVQVRHCRWQSLRECLSQESSQRDDQFVKSNLRTHPDISNKLSE